MIFLLTFVSTLFISYLIIRSKAMLAAENLRGSHIGNIATSGGLAIFIPFAYTALYFNNSFDLHLVLLLGLITFLGFIDDILDLSHFIRISIQILLSIIFAATYLSNDIIDILITSFFIIYVINSLNFFDGIDLLVSSQMIFIFISLLLLIYTASGISTEFSMSLIFIMLACISSLIGFSLFNYPPATLFLGSSGTYFLGFLLSIIFAILIYNQTISIYTCLILYSVPMVDTSMALITRFFCKFKNEISKNEVFIKSIYHALKRIILIPHSLHNYQIMSRKYKSHLKSTLLITILNIIWCLPLAMMSHLYSEYSIIALIAAIIPYVIICIYNKTGIEKY